MTAPGSRSTGMTVSDALDAAATAIEAAGASTPRLDAELLVADALGIDRAGLFMDPDLEVPPAAARVLGENVRRRVQREPVAYILGRRGFRYLELTVDPRAIIPRPETELLVELALDLPEGARVHDVGTGAGSIALALLHERPDLRVTASEPYEPAAAVARENAERLGLPLEVSSDFGLPPGDYDLVVANLPYVPEGDWPRHAAGDPRLRAARGVRVRSGRPGRHPRADRAGAARDPARARARRGTGRRGERAARRRRDLSGPRPLGAHHGGTRSLTPEEVATFERCVSVGGVALFPADTVYGLATDPDSSEGVRRLYALKGRAPDRPAAVMFFGLAPALATLPELGPRTRAAAERLLPGAVTLVLPNPAGRFPLACGPEPERLGLRVPALSGALAPLAGMGRPVLQSSANRSGGADVRRLGDVDAGVRAGVDMILDGGELPGTASTVVDLLAYEDAGVYSIRREGAVPGARVGEALARLEGGR